MVVYFYPAPPTDQETCYLEACHVTTEGNQIIELILAYKGCGEYIRKVLELT